MADSADVKLTWRMETETVSLGSSSRDIGENLESFKALVMAYSRRPKNVECTRNQWKTFYKDYEQTVPEWRSIALNVPMHPRKRLSLPIFQVTNNGLCELRKKNIRKIDNLISIDKHQNFNRYISRKKYCLLTHHHNISFHTPLKHPWRHHRYTQNFIMQLTMPDLWSSDVVIRLRSAIRCATHRNRRCTYQEWPPWPFARAGNH